jgi:hypothetical protein
VPLWTPWGKGFKGVALRSALGPPSVQRPALGSYTTSWDANAPSPPVTGGQNWLMIRKTRSLVAASQACSGLTGEDGNGTAGRVGCETKEC